jgi:hypothetical protein
VRCMQVEGRTPCDWGKERLHMVPC